MWKVQTETVESDRRSEEKMPVGIDEYEWCRARKPAMKWT
jgi:hypothetical protein